MEATDMPCSLMTIELDAANLLTNLGTQEVEAAEQDAQARHRAWKNMSTMIVPGKNIPMEVLPMNSLLMAMPPTCMYTKLQKTLRPNTASRQGYTIDP